jgi:tetratricopeptide (TPR) repeat protein
MAGLLGLFTACSSGPAPRFESGSNSFDAPGPRQSVADAEQLIQNGNPAAAVGRLQEVVARYPDRPEAQEARYLLGLAYEALGGVGDAIRAYESYLAFTPKGPWADESRMARDRLRNQYEASFPSRDKLDREIESLRAVHQAQPASAERALGLADALWMRGDYEEAGAIYIDLAKHDPGFAKSDHFTTRIEPHDDGSHTVLTPSEVGRREKARNPIEVINVNSFGAVRDSFTQIPRFFVVTGQAVNRGGSVMHGVGVTVTIYGFGNIVYDTDTTQMGDLNPGEIRAFSMRFSNFRELNSIDRVDHAVSFRR